MKLGKIFWGLLFVLAGVFVIINQLGWCSNINLFTLFVSIILVVWFIKGLIHINFTEMLFSLAFGSILYSDYLNIDKLTPWPVLFAALFLSIGLSLIFNKKHFHHEENFDEVINNSETCVETRFSSTIKYVNNEDFKEGKINCKFGAVKMYLDKAIIKEEKAILNLNISFGGVELYIPKDWQVINKVNVTLAGLEEKNKNNNVTTKQLILTGNMSFAGVEIIYI